MVAPGRPAAREWWVLDHIGIGVSDYGRGKAFYQAALAPLGYSLMMEQGGYPGFGVAGPLGQHELAFWIFQADSPMASPLTPVHVAFRAVDRAAVTSFHTQALTAGGRDNGGPGLRPHYHPSYFAAFVLDVDGHNIEAVCHAAA
jgi:catechol 2,3-dioxygenase-like lactoylglutathione lyase family enzyme